MLNYVSDINDISNFWYYEYEEGSEKGILNQLDDKISLLEKFEEIKVNIINYHPIILREKIRLALINLKIISNIYKKSLPEKIKQNI